MWGVRCSVVGLALVVTACGAPLGQSSAPPPAPTVPGAVGLLNGPPLAAGPALRNRAYEAQFTRVTRAVGVALAAAVPLMADAARTGTQTPYAFGGVAALLSKADTAAIGIDAGPYPGRATAFSGAVVGLLSAFSATDVDPSTVSAELATYDRAAARYGADLGAGFTPLLAALPATPYGPSTTTTVPPPTTAAAPVSPGLSISGSGAMATSPFAVPSSPWTIHYSYQCPGGAGSDPFTIDVTSISGGSGDAPTSIQGNGASGSGSATEQGTGTYFLSVLTLCDWQVSAGS